MAISADVKSQLFRQSSSNDGGEKLIRLPLESDDGLHSGSDSSGASSPSSGACSSNGKAWTREEHERFLEGLELFPSGPWKEVAAFVGTRTTRQTMTHAQKYREKIARRKRGLRSAASSSGSQRRATTTTTTTTANSGKALAKLQLERPDAFAQQLKLAQAQASPTSVAMMKSEQLLLEDPLDFNGCFLDFELELELEPGTSTAATTPQWSGTGSDFALDQTLLMALATSEEAASQPQLSLSDEDMDLIMDSVVTSAARAHGLQSAFSFVC